MEAHEMILSLNLEINTLKRKLKLQESERGTNTFSTTNSNAANNEVFNRMNQHADDEVDQLMGADMNIPVLPGTGGRPDLATPFDRWKMQQFVYAPNTPAASEAHDKAVVDMLLAASTMQLQDDYAKPTKSGIAKMKRLVSLTKLRVADKKEGYDYRLGTATADAGGANGYEGVGEDFDNTGAQSLRNSGSWSLAVPRVQHTAEDEKFFLEMSSPMWGGGPRFDRDNMGRNNLWASSTVNRTNTASGSGTASRKTRTAAGALSPVNPRAKAATLSGTNSRTALSSSADLGASSPNTKIRI